MALGIPMNCLAVKRFVLLLALFRLLPAQAQDVWHDEAIRTYQGLPSDIVFKTQVDDNGFLYIATAKGLSRYDGYRFVSSEAIKAGMTDLVSCPGKFYFHNTGYGLASFSDIYAKPAIISANDYQDENPDNDHFDNLFVDSQKRVWCSDFSNVKYFSDAVSKPVSFRLGAVRSQESLRIKFIEPKPGTIWVLTSSGIWVWTQKTGRLERHPHPELARLSCVSAIRLSKNRIVVATADNRIVRIDPEAGKPELIAVSPENLIGFAKLPGRGLIAYSRNAVYAVKANAVNAIYVAQKSQINHVLADASAEILWLSTNKGLVKLAPVDAVANYRLASKTGENLVVTSIAEDASKTLWLADKKSNVWSRDAMGKISNHRIAANISSVTAFGNAVFVATDRGLYAIASGEIQKLRLPATAPIKKAVLTAKSELWLLLDKKPVLRFSWPTLQPLPILANAPEFWTENRWNDIFEASDGKVWLAGWAPKAYGIDVYDNKKNAFFEISDLKANADRDKFFGDYVNRIAQNSDKSLLFSGYGGFCVVSPKGNVTRKVDINSYPISDGRIEGIASDAQGNVIFGTGDGLHLYNEKRDDILRLSQLDGLPSDDLVYGFAKLSDGKIALGTENGFSLLNLQKMLEPQSERSLRLSGVSVEGKMRQGVSGAIELSKDESDATVFFSDLSFSDRNKVFYRYRFADEKRWNELGDNPEVSLNHMEPGTYNLIIQKRHVFGPWQKDSLEIVLIAHPPFYRSPVFYALCFLLLLLGITAIYSYLLKRQRKEAAFRQKIREAEMTTLRAQMNPHFMFNTLNSINSFIIQHQTEAASDYLTTFSKLMRNILEYSKEEAISLDQELQALKLYMELESMRLERSFDYTIKVDRTLKGNPLVKIPPLVIQPFVENAIWHGLLHKPGAGNLWITASAVDDERFSISIEDDGIGREKAATLKKEQTSHKSYGVDITTERILLLHPENRVEIRDLKNPDGSAKGTAVVITFKW